MGERNINPIHNIHTSKKYKEVIFINPYSFGNGFDVDANAFISAAGITDTTQKTAINQLVIDLKSAGIWSSMFAIYPFVGGTAATHKWNLKDPRDLDAAYRLSFLGTLTHNSTGITGNGTNGYANTFFTPFSGGMTSGSGHLSFYSRSSLAGGDDLSAVGSGESVTRIICRFSDNTSYSSIAAIPSSRISFTETDGKGFFQVNRTTTALTETYKGATLKGSNTFSTTPTLTDRSLYLFARNQSIGATDFSAKNCAFSSIGLGLSSSLALQLNTIVTAFQTTLGRQN